MLKCTAAANFMLRKYVHTIKCSINEKEFIIIIQVRNFYSRPSHTVLLILAKTSCFFIPIHTEYQLKLVDMRDFIEDYFVAGEIIWIEAIILLLSCRSAPYHGLT